jgi:hypothetical protein
MFFVHAVMERRPIFGINNEWGLQIYHVWRLTLELSGGEAVRLERVVRPYTRS